MNQPLVGRDCPEHCRVTEVVAMAHVRDVDRSVEFYTKLGFKCDSRFSSPSNVTNWAAISSGKARMFLSRASGPIDANEQAVLFYMYCNSVLDLRYHLLERGLRDGGDPPGEGPFPTLELAMEGYVFNIVQRFYMPDGELRIHDPDGYCILVGQIG